MRPAHTLIFLAFALGLAGTREQRAGLAHQVEGDVGQRDVFLQDGAVAAPFGVALTQYQGIICQMKGVGKKLCV